MNEENIAKLRAIPQRNIDTNILMRVMKEKLQDVRKTNITISKSFSARFPAILEKYNHRKDNEYVFEVFEELIKFKILEQAKVQAAYM